MDTLNEIIQNAPELWAAMGVLFGSVILLLVGIAGIFLAGTKAWVYGRLLVAEVRGHRQAILEAVDEPTDRIPQQIAALTPWEGDTPLMWSTAMRTALEFVFNQLEASRAEAIPTPERETLSDA